MRVTFEGTWEEIQKQAHTLAHYESVSTDAQNVKPAKAKTTTKAAEVATPPTGGAVSNVEVTRTAFGVVEGKDPIHEIEKPAAIVGGVTFDDIKVIIPQVIASLGREAAVALLAKFNAKKGGDILPAQYALFVYEAKNLIAGAQKKG